MKILRQKNELTLFNFTFHFLEIFECVLIFSARAGPNFVLNSNFWELVNFNMIMAKPCIVISFLSPEKWKIGILALQWIQAKSAVRFKLVQFNVILGFIANATLFRVRNAFSKWLQVKICSLKF